MQEFTFQPSIMKGEVDNTEIISKNVGKDIDRVRNARMQRENDRKAMERGEKHEDQEGYFVFGAGASNKPALAKITKPKSKSTSILYIYLFRETNKSRSRSRRSRNY